MKMNENARPEIRGGKAMQGLQTEREKWNRGVGMPNGIYYDYRRSLVNQVVAMRAEQARREVVNLTNGELEALLKEGGRGI